MAGKVNVYGYQAVAWVGTMEPGDVHGWIHWGGGAETYGAVVGITARIVATSRDENGTPDEGILAVEYVQYERGSDSVPRTFFSIRNASPVAEVFGYGVFLTWTDAVS